MFGRKHQHTWIAVSRQPHGYGTKNTLVLHRCRCGELETWDLDGEWSDEDLGIHARRANDLREVLDQTRD